MDLGGLVGDRFEGGAPQPGGAGVVGDAEDVQTAECRCRQAYFGHRQRDRIGVQRRKVGAVFSEQREDALQHKPALRRAEQAPMVGDCVPTGGDARFGEVGDDVGAQTRRDGPDQRFGGTARVELVAGSVGACSDDGSLVIVARDGENRSGQLGSPASAPTRPSGVPAVTSGGINDSPAPDHSNVSGHQSRSARRSHPVREASDCSVASSPPSPRTIHSATLSRRTAVRAAGTLSISHRCLVSDHCCRSGRPVVAEKFRVPTVSVRSGQLRMIAGVVPRDDGCHWVAVLVEQDPGLGDACHSEPAYRAGRTVGQGFCHGGFRRIEQGVRIEFRARPRHRPWSGGAPGRDRLAVVGEDDGLARACPDVQADEQGAAHVAPSTTLLVELECDGYSCVSLEPCQAITKDVDATRSDR